MAANSRANIELVLGGGSVNATSPFGDIPTLKNILKLLKREGVTRIDTAHLYGDSEELLGKVEAGENFIINSKMKGGFEPGSAKRREVIDGVDLSLKRLKIGKLGIFDIHTPDHDVSIEKTLEAANDLFRAGKFERFSLSNYNPKDVEVVYDHCKAKGYMLPTAYQGNYSAAARALESDLFPVLRRLSISFYAYSPMAGASLPRPNSKYRTVLAASTNRPRVVVCTSRCTKSLHIWKRYKSGIIFRRPKTAARRLSHIDGLCTTHSSVETTATEF
jgi:aflatoxin B1 aldehyde reductase